MDTLFPILGIACFLLICLLVLVGIGALVLVLARQLSQKTDRNWQQLADRLGLTYGRDEVTTPYIAGHLHGVAVCVEATRTTKTVTRADGSHNMPMVWTRVSATPVSQPKFELWLRKNKPPQPVGLIEKRTGDAEFDQRYCVYVSPEVEIEAACPASVRQIILQAPRQVQIAANSVIWTNGFIDHDRARLFEALESVAHVANAIDEHSANATA